MPGTTSTMDEKASQLLAALKRPALKSDTKLNLLNSLKADIKHCNVPDSATAPVFECVKQAIAQQASSQLSQSAFSTLAHLIKRLRILDPEAKAVAAHAPALYPVLKEKLGDAREGNRASASQAFSELWPILTIEVERIIREEVIGGANGRAKEAGMGWVVRMHRDDNMPFKSFVAPIVACLEDSDGQVREAGKNALVELFSSAPEGAKADLRKQLKMHAVRQGIQTAVLSQLGGEKGMDSDLAASTRSLPALEHVTKFADVLNSEEAIPPPQESVQLDPIYVHSERELSDTFRDMLPHFEGKETEQNWMPRDKAVLKVRRLLKGNAPNEYHMAFMAGIKSSIEGILKVANSLRTTMSTNGCQLVNELTRTLGPALDPHTEILLQSFVKMSSATKHIASENGKHTADAIFQHCSYNRTLMQHIWAAAQDKNASTRQCAPIWLKTILKRQTGYKSHFESSGGLDLAEKSIRKGLDDANPKVKEAMRATYWTFAKGWPEKAEAIAGKLDAKSRALLEKDSNNPNASLHESHSSSTASRPAAVTSRSTLKELMAEQRRAKSAAQNLPERPGSAMAALSPAKPRPELSSAQRGPSRLRQESHRVASTASTASTVASTTATTRPGNSLMSGPVRRPRRPEIQRPQTADPYASRQLMRPETPANGTPGTTAPRGTAQSKTSIPSNSASRNRAKTAGTVAPRSREGSPNLKRSPVHASRTAPDSRPSSKDSNAPRTEGLDDLTMVMPIGRNGIGKRTAALMGATRPALDKTMSVDSGLPSMVEEDGGFTMVIPNLTQSVRARSPLSTRSPLRNQFEQAHGLADRASLSASHSRQRSDPFIEAAHHGSLTPRRGSPVKSVSPHPAPVQIYEDPAASREREIAPGAERQVLGELPVNENKQLHSPAHSAGSSTSPTASPRHIFESRSPLLAAATPQDRAESQRNRRMLASGIEKLRTRTLDAHGLRKVQDLARSPHTENWDSGVRFDELMTALLDFLPALDSDPKLTALHPTKLTGLKQQSLALLRTLLSTHRKLATQWYALSLTAALSLRGSLDSTSCHILADLERTVSDIVKLTPGPEPSLHAIISLLPLPSTASPRATVLALSTLRSLLTLPRPKPLALESSLRAQLAGTAAKHIGDADAEVRKAGVELACEVFVRLYKGGGEDGGEMVGKEGFWREFRGVDEGRMGLLSYYIARREGAVGVA
ncbi:suppressor of tub2 mutation [Oleoguttula sp. CCFEE 5521]